MFTEAGVQSGGGGDSEEEVREKWSCLDPAFFFLFVFFLQCLLAAAPLIEKYTNSG